MPADSVPQRLMRLAVEVYSVLFYITKTSKAMKTSIWGFLLAVPMVLLSCSKEDVPLPVSDQTLV